MAVWPAKPVGAAPLFGCGIRRHLPQRAYTLGSKPAQAIQMTVEMQSVFGG
jgi:hypothetical protein